MCTNCAMKAMPKEEFAGRIMEFMNGGATALMISVGHRTGLFDAMKNLGEYATSREIADTAGLNERYVREWLGTMTTARIVECTSDGPRFRLPESHGAVLGSDAGADNIAVLTQYIAQLGSVEDGIVECFRRGGGVPYENYARFEEIMREDSNQWGVAPLFDHILPLVPGMRERLESGIDVLDCGCGSGRALIALAKAFPKSRFTGFDLLSNSIQNARAMAAELSLKNVTFEQRDLSTFDQDAPVAAFDFITTFDAVHDQPRPDNLLKGIRNALRPDGVYLMIDIDASSNVYENMEHPIGPLLYTISCMHCMTVSLAQGGMGLGAVWGRQMALDLLRMAGFRSVDIKNLEHDIQNCYYVVRP